MNDIKLYIPKEDADALELYDMYLLQNGILKHYTMNSWIKIDVVLDQLEELKPKHVQYLSDFNKNEYYRIQDKIKKQFYKEVLNG